MKSTYSRIIAGIAALLLVVAAVAGGTMLLERREQRALEARLREQAGEIEDVLWTEDNTVYIDSTLYGYDHRIETYLFIGTDLSGNESAEGEDYNGAMADYLLLMVLDHTDNTIGCLQIDRNTITPVDELDENGDITLTRDLQICTAHWFGSNRQMSAENTVEAVKRLLGELERIDGYYVINMREIGALNHAVGGVEITLSEDLSAVDPAMTLGSTLTLSDAQAEAFVRARMSVGEGTNVERMSRQQQYMEALLDKVRAEVRTNSQYGVELWNMIRDIAESNMNGNAFSRIANKLLKGEDKGILKLQGHTELGHVLNDGLEHEEFYADTASIRDVMTELFSLVPAEEEPDEATDGHAGDAKDEENTDDASQEG